jgi:hypothetical protein
MSYKPMELSHPFEAHHAEDSQKFYTIKELYIKAPSLTALHENSFIQGLRRAMKPAIETVVSEYIQMASDADLKPAKKKKGSSKELDGVDTGLDKAALSGLVHSLRTHETTKIPQKKPTDPSNIFDFWVNIFANEMIGNPEVGIFLYKSCEDKDRLTQLYKPAMHPDDIECLLIKYCESFLI